MEFTLAGMLSVQFHADIRDCLCDLVCLELEYILRRVANYKTINIRTRPVRDQYCHFY